MKGTSNSPDFSDHDTVRDTPHIPDYELIRCVGKGAYGEVWLGRTVTGSLRAVKIVRRDTFEMERTFRREVEGIENFEPISRGHPGLVDILHVGWKEEEGFFYYIMELADDRLHGQQIQLTDYEPRTLASARMPGEKLPLDQCIDVGISLADALAYLHDRNLIHRDIKPSNVVFVDGEAKLVDIGLVAPTGQRTFVGTEGFVPPEGPGSTSADLYSLGMVLYEISTGNDRLEFPELPTSGFLKQELSKWQRLNQIICKACSPRPDKRYSSAREMTEDLRDLRAGRKAKVAGGRRFAQCAAVLSIGAAVGLAFAAYQGRLQNISWPWTARKSDPVSSATGSQTPLAQSGNEQKPIPPENPRTPDKELAEQNSKSEPRFGSLLIETVPPGATVLLDGTKDVGKTGKMITAIPPGRQKFELRLEDYDTATVTGDVLGGQPLVLKTTLQLSKGPRPGEPWTNSLGMVFSPPSPNDSSLVSAMAMSANDVDRAPDAIRRLGMNGDVQLLGNHPAIKVTRDIAMQLCDELTSFERKAGFIPPNSLYEPGPGSQASGFSGDDHQRSRFHLKLTTYASLTIITEPVGAEIWLNGEQQPSPTPVTLSELKTAAYEIIFKKEGFEDLEISELSIVAGTHETLSRTLKKSRKLVLGTAWTNSLGMRFVPLGDVMLSQWETRREDYNIFAELTGRGDAHVPEFRQGPKHPVVGVNREDAEAFCRWLTARELVEGFLPEDVAYRLPTDLEWSQAAGREAERGSTPKERDQQFTGVYPWGYDWPPAKLSGNFADDSEGNTVIRKALLGDIGAGRLVGYPEDGYAFTAPVGSFPPDKRGKGGQFHDLSGNAWEWVADDYDPHITRGREGVLRGGSWNASKKEELWTTYRYSLPSDIPAQRLTWENGFRCALARRVKAN